MKLEAQRHGYLFKHDILLHIRDLDLPISVTMVKRLAQCMLLHYVRTLVTSTTLLNIYGYKPT